MSRRKIDRSKQYPAFTPFDDLWEAPEEDEYLFRDPDSPFFEQWMRSMSTFTQVTAENEEDVRRYMEAHHYLPFDYFYTGTAAETAAVCTAASILKNGRLPEDTLIAAIVLLGHSPCQHSLNALGTLASGDHPLAGIADVALEECLHLGGPEALFIA